MIPSIHASTQILAGYYWSRSSVIPVSFIHK
jgi:hypothetical protein